MSCARIRNKPVKFLDPQEKLILELKDQIKRLRNENKKLRSTLLTAPASTSDKSLLGNFSPTREGDNEESSPMARASSAHGFRDRDFSQHSIAHGSPIRKKPNNAAALKKKKKQKQPEIFYKYPQLQKILKDEPLEVSSPPKSRNTAASHAHQRPAGKPSVLASSEQDSLLEVMNHDHHDSPGGGSTSSKSKIKVEVLDEMVHRRAPGPLIMKDSSAVPTLRDSRLGQYYPAENYIKTMDAKRIEILEQKIAELEDGRKKKGVQESDADTDHEHASHADHGNISVDGSQFVKKKKGKKKKTPHWKAEKEQKPSPYIAHMQKKAQEQAKAKADKLEQAAVRRKGSIAEEDSQFDEHPKVEAKKKDKDLHHAIMDELEELGLGPTPAPQQRPAPAKKASEANNQHKKPPMAPKPTKAAPVKANVGAKKEPSASHHQSLPTLPSQGKKQVIINGETLEEKFKLPKLPNSREAKPANEKEVMKQSLTEPILPSITKAKVEKKVEAKEEEEDDEEDHDYDYEFEENEQESGKNIDYNIF